MVACTADWDSIIRYPACPAYERLLAALGQQDDPSDDRGFANAYVGRRGFRLFMEAGLKEIEVQVHSTCMYPGSEYFDSWYEERELLLDLNGPAAEPLGRLIALGVLDKETILAVQREMDVWHRSPYAFSTHAGILVAGRAG